MEQQYNFTIADKPVKVLESAEVITYTILINRTLKDNTFFENLVVEQFSDGEVRANIIKYTPFQPNNFQSYFSDGNFAGNRTLLPVIYNANESSLTGKFTNICSRVCTTICYQTTQSGPHSEPHTPGHDCTDRSFIETDCERVCEWVDDGGGDGNTGSTETTGGDGSNNTPVGNPVNNCGNCNVPVYTAPVLEEEEEETPCEKLNKNSANNPAYMANFNELNMPAKFNLPHESGFALNILNNGLAQYSYLSPLGNNKLFIPSGSLNYTHVHNNVIKTIGTITRDMAVKMFSPADLSVLLTTCQVANNNAGVDSENAFGVMISDESIFSITLLEPYSHSADFNQRWKEFKKNYKTQTDNIINNLDLSPTERTEKLEKMFLKQLKNLGLENKVALFKGEVKTVLGNKKLKWTRKILVSNTVIGKPC